jgi:hypothetical protein
MDADGSNQIRLTYKPGVPRKPALVTCHIEVIVPVLVELLSDFGCSAIEPSTD